MTPKKLTPEFMKEIEDLLHPLTHVTGAGLHKVAIRELLSHIRAVEAELSASKFVCSEEYGRGYRTAYQDSQEEIDALRAERDALRKDAVEREMAHSDRLRKIIDNTVAERDALSARVEKLRAALEYAAKARWVVNSQSTGVSHSGLTDEAETALRALAQDDADAKKP